MHQGWIRPESLDAVVDYLARLAGYEWDPTDQAALLAGVAATDSERDRWFRYYIVGEPDLTLELANDPESRHVLHMRVEGPPEVARELAVLLALAGNYSLLLPGRGQ